MKLARNCEYWHYTEQWRGNCKKHPWVNDKYSQEATCYHCPDYVDKLDKYRKEVKA